MRNRHFSMIALFCMGIVLLGIYGMRTLSAAPKPILSFPAAATPVMSSDYLLILEMPSVVPVDTIVNEWLTHWTPTLASYEAEGQLSGFQVIPTAGAILLQSPSTELLAAAETWAGVGQILSATDDTTVQTRWQLFTEYLHEGQPATPPQTKAPDVTSGVNGLTSFSMHLNNTDVEGNVNTANIPITLTLKTGTVVKSQVQTVADGTFFRAYFTNVIEGNDTIEIEMPGSPLTIVPVADLGLNSDKAADIIYGVSPANGWVEVQVWSWADRQWYVLGTTADGSGNFAADFNTHPQSPDIFMGDQLYLNYWDSNGFKTYLGWIGVTGFFVNPISDYVSGYAAPSSTVNSTVRDSSGVIKSTATHTADGYGSFYVQFAGVADIVVGDQVQVQYGAQPTQTLQVVDVQVTSITPATDIVQGTAPANSKTEVYAYDSYLANRKTLVVQSNGGGVYSANFSGLFDILPGSYASVTYHDSLDNEVGGAILYAGPYVRVSLNSYNSVWAVGLPAEEVNVTLRNALNAIKGTAVGLTNTGGSVNLTIRDSLGNVVYPIPGDVIEVSFASGATRSVNVVGVDYIADRDTRTVYGSAPANTDLRLIYYDGTQTANVMADNNGNFSYTFPNRLTGGYSLRVLYRNQQGDDIEIYGYVPQFTIQKTSRYVSGYGPARRAVVTNLLDSSLAVKETRSSTTNDYGYYYLSFSSAIVPGDTVVVDVGPLHYEQVVVPLTIAADTMNNIVYGTAPPNAWLNVFDQNYFGPYDMYNYRYFHADGLGNYATNFGQVRGNDWLSVIYWQNGYKDRVSIGQYAPGMSLNHVLNRIAGYTTPGAVGTITVRSSGGALKASETVTATTPYGSFAMTLNDADLVSGDEVTAAIGVLNLTSDVIPLTGMVNIAANTVSGTSLPNIELGVAAYHWTGSSYSSYVSGVNLSQFVNTNASGAFTVDYSGLVDLEVGDFMTLYYIDDQDTQQSASFYTTSPVVTVDSYPTAVQPNGPVDVLMSVSAGAHVQNVYVRWDTEPRADSNAYRYWSNWQQGSIGQNLVSFNAPSGGTIYFKAYAYVDGQGIWSDDEHTIDVDTLTATTLYDPVSGTTNNNTPTIYGVAAPDAEVTLYQGDTAVATTTASDTGYFTFNITTPLAPGQYTFHAVSTVNGETGPNSNPVALTVDPTLPVDPVHILVTARGLTQHLRDQSGYANLGGRIWTRTGDVVNMSIPISPTNVYSASLYVGGVFATNLLDSGGGVYVSAYTPPTSGSYSVDLKMRINGPSDPVTTINILTGLIDPDGYVYDADLGFDYRIAGATVTCYELVNSTNNLWLPWNATIWDQINPQIVGSDGYYAFFTLPGSYKLVVTAPGYWSYESPVLTVVDEPVHHNVPLRQIRTIYLPVITR